MYFCADKSCLQIDSAASKGKSHSIVVSDKDAAYLFGVGDRYVNATLSKWNANPTSSELVSKWLRRPENMLVIAGAVRTGKTYFLMAMANYLLDSHHPVKYLLYRRFFDELKKAIEKDQSPSYVIDQYANMPYLLLDDVGASQNTEWQKEVFLDLIDRRYSNQKPTVITTNFNEEQCKNELGERTSRRIFDHDNLIISLGPEYAR